MRRIPVSGSGIGSISGSVSFVALSGSEIRVEYCTIELENL